MLAPMIRIKSAVRTSLMASLKSGAIPSPKRTTSGFRDDRNHYKAGSCPQRFA